MEKSLEGKWVKIIFNDGRRVRVARGRVISLNDSFLVTQDKHGKIHFLNVNVIHAIHEIKGEV